MFIYFQEYVHYVSRLEIHTHENKNMLLPLRIKICFQPARACLALLRN